MDRARTPPWLAGIVFFATYLVVAVLVTGFWKGWSQVLPALPTDAFSGAVAAAVFAVAIHWYQARKRTEDA